MLATLALRHHMFLTPFYAPVPTPYSLRIEQLASPIHAISPKHTSSLGPQLVSSRPSSPAWALPVSERFSSVLQSGGGNIISRQLGTDSPSNPQCVATHNHQRSSVTRACCDRVGCYCCSGVAALTVTPYWPHPQISRGQDDFASGAVQHGAATIVAQAYSASAVRRRVRHAAAHARASSAG